MSDHGGTTCWKAYQNGEKPLPGILQVTVALVEHRHYHCTKGTQRLYERNKDALSEH